MLTAMIKIIENYNADDNHDDDNDGADDLDNDVDHAMLNTNWYIYFWLLCFTIIFFRHLWPTQLYKTLS